VYVPFDVLQRDLDMAARTTEDIDVTTGAPFVVSARTTELQIDIKPGTDPATMVEPIAAIVSMVTGDPLVGQGGRLNVQTWQQAQAIWLAAIEKEVILVTMLFGIISLVAVFLIFVIFYMIVVEKTRDIGIIKSVGATNAGVAGIFLGYGLAIGVVGAGLGFAVALAIVTNINYLHEQMGKLLNVQIWDPQVYQFDTIPNTMDPRTVAMILITAVIASLMGAVVPAIRAARMNPVEALRFE
jgi:lipoprotein-releasing system permease protein